MPGYHDSVTYAANKIYEKYPDLIRLYKVYHPAYELKVHIQKKNEAPTYHVIQRYMDKLLCEGEFTEEEVCELLGLNKQAYEISRLFFQDLIKNGHCEAVGDETPPQYRGTALASDSVRDLKMYIPGEDLVSKLFDQYTLHLLPGDFYEMGRMERSIKTIPQDDNKAVWLPIKIFSPDGTISETTAISQMIGNHVYSNNEQDEYSLPIGYKGMRLADDGNENPEIRYFPYYLGIRRDSGSGQKTYCAFRVDNRREIPWVGEQYLTSAFAEARALIDHLSDVQEMDVQNPIANGKVEIGGKKVQDPRYQIYNIKSDGRVLSENGISVDQEGNYVWNVSDKQVADMTGGLPGSKQNIKMCRKVAYNDIIYLDRFEAGRIIHIVKTEKQKQYLLDILDEKQRAVR